LLWTRACLLCPLDLDLNWRGFDVAVIQLAGLLHHEQTPCLSFRVQTRLQWLQCPCGAFWSGFAITLEIILSPFQKRASVHVRDWSLLYSVFKVLFVLCFQLHCVTKIHKVKFQELARLSPCLGVLKKYGKTRKAFHSRKAFSSWQFSALVWSEYQ